VGCLLGAASLQGCARGRVGVAGAPNPKAQAAFERGSTALEAGRYSEAIPELYTVLDEHPSHLVARYNLGVALLRLKQYKETVDALTAAHESTVPRKKLPAGVRVPHDVDADYLHALGTAYQERREFHKSLACFEAAVAADAAHLKSHYARALTLEAQGELIAARMAWIEYLSRDADSAWGEGARHHLAEVERLLKAESETQTP
jgi:tetratricopeptide (TPR) repeat protein